MSRMRFSAFTIVELLVVMAIISVLIALLLPVLGRARDSAHNVTCQSNLRQIGLALSIYSADNKGILSPPHLYTTVQKNCSYTAIDIILRGQGVLMPTNNLDYIYSKMWACRMSNPVGYDRLQKGLGVDGNPGGAPGHSYFIPELLHWVSNINTGASQTFYRDYQVKRPEQRLWLAETTDCNGSEVRSYDFYDGGQDGGYDGHFNAGNHLTLDGVVKNINNRHRIYTTGSGVAWWSPTSSLNQP